MLAKDVRLAQNGCQHVVKIVGHSAGKSSHRLHLLSLSQPLFQLFALGDVADNGQQSVIAPDYRLL